MFTTGEYTNFIATITNDKIPELQVNQLDPPFPQDPKKMNKYTKKGMNK